MHHIQQRTRGITLCQLLLTDRTVNTHHHGFNGENQRDRGRNGSNSKEQGKGLGRIFATVQNMKKVFVSLTLTPLSLVLSW